MLTLHAKTGIRKATAFKFDVKTSYSSMPGWGVGSETSVSDFWFVEMTLWISLDIISNSVLIFWSVAVSHRATILKALILFCPYFYLLGFFYFCITVVCKNVTLCVIIEHWDTRCAVPTEADVHQLLYQSQRLFYTELKLLWYSYASVWSASNTL